MDNNYIGIPEIPVGVPPTLAIAIWTCGYTEDEARQMMMIEAGEAGDLAEE
jgi:hypothetical protein